MHPESTVFHKQSIYVQLAGISHSAYSILPNNFLTANYMVPHLRNGSLDRMSTVFAFEGVFSV